MNLPRFSHVAAAMLVGVALAGCHRNTNYEWHQVESADGNFSLMLPGAPATQEHPVKSDTGGSFISHGLRARASDTASYGCFWWEDPRLAGRSPDQILDAARDNGLSGLQGKVITEKRITVQGYRARDIHAIVGGTISYDNRLVLVGNRLYTLLVVDKRGRDIKNVETFFNSLVLR